MDAVDISFSSLLLSPTTFVLLCALVVAWYFNYVRSYNYWSSIGVPGPKPKFPSGNFNEFVETPSNNVHARWAKEYGKCYGIYEGRKPILLTTDQTLVKEVFIKYGHIFTDRRYGSSGEKHHRLNLANKKGEDWKADRRLMSPTFTSGKMKAMLSLMFECYKNLDKELERIVKRGKEVDAKIVFSKLTSAIICRCAFATEIDPYTEDDPLLRNLHRMFEITKIRWILLRMLPDWAKNLIQISGIPVVNEYVKGVCKEILKKRKQMAMSGEAKINDLIQLLIEAGTEAPQATSVPDHESHHGMEDDADAQKALNSTFNNQANAKKRLTEDEIIANVIVFFAAGFETTSTLLGYASYVLTTEPDVQERLYQELKATYEQNKGDWDYEALSSQPYLDSFICETLRLYPPPIRLERLVNQDFTLSNGIVLKKGSVFGVPLDTLHKDPDYYENPEKFDIERFLPKNRGKIIPCTFVPFGTGPRNCIGMRFSLLEGKMTLAHLLLKYKFVKTTNTTNTLKFKPLVTILTVDGPIWIKLEKR